MRGPVANRKFRSFIVAGIVFALMATVIFTPLVLLAAGVVLFFLALWLVIHTIMYGEES